MFGFLLGIFNHFTVIIEMHISFKPAFHGGYVQASFKMVYHGLKQHIRNNFYSEDLFFTLTLKTHNRSFNPFCRGHTALRNHCRILLIDWSYLLKHELFSAGACRGYFKGGGAK